MDMTAVASTPARWGRIEIRVVGLIGLAHGLSHFYIFLLPPLLPVLREVYALSWIEIGMLLTTFNVVSALTQAPMGFLVDRLGGRQILMFGLVLEGVAFGSFGFVDSFPVLLMLAAAAGLANATYHPADYSILSASIERGRQGRAFSLHIFSGYLGGAIAPATMVALMHLVGWRTGLAIAGGLGVVAALLLFAFGSSLRDDTRAKTGAASVERGSGLALVFSPPVMAFLVFYMLIAAIGGGLGTFSVASLTALHGIGLAEANMALTGYLVGGALGVLVGGYLADRTARHDLMAAIGFAGTAVCVLPVAYVNPPLVLLIAALAVAGLCHGAVQPARDMMVRQVAPAGDTGKVFGFVSTGFNVGGAICPPIYGWLMDQGEPRAVLLAVVALGLVASVTTGLPGRLAKRKG